MKRTIILKYLAALLFAAAICFMSMPVRAQAATIKLNKTKKTIYVGHSYRHKLKNATEKVTWKSTDKSVATVTSKGKVKAKAAGKCKIKATSGGKTYTCTVTVKESPETETDTTTAYTTLGKHFKYGEEPFSEFKLREYTTQKTLSNSIFDSAEITLVYFFKSIYSSIRIGQRSCSDFESLISKYLSDLQQ